MADSQQLRRIKRSVAEWNSWRQDAPKIRPDLSRANLSEENLSSANLSYTNLSRTDLFQADLAGGNLQGADLTEADLRNANLAHCDLTEADLPEANLAGCNLPGTQLRDATLARADLRGTNLTDANIRNTNLNSAMYNNGTTWPNAFEFAASGAVSMPDGNVSEVEPPPPSFRSIAESLAVYLGIPALVLYPVGLFMLAVQLWDLYDVKFITGWYAASLAPKVMVAGHGAKTFLLPVAVSFVVAFIIAKILYFWRPRSKPWSSSTWNLLKKAGRLQWQIVRTRQGLLFLELLMFVLLPAIVIFIVVAKLESANAFVVPAAWVAGCIGGLVMYLQHQNGNHRGMKLSRGVGQGWILPGLAVAYLLGLSCSLFALVVVESTVLPRVDMERHINQNHWVATDGFLLGHSDSYWYILHIRKLPRILDFVPAQSGEHTDVASISSTSRNQFELVPIYSRTYHRSSAAGKPAKQSHNGTDGKEGDDSPPPKGDDPPPPKGEGGNKSPGQDNPQLPDLPGRTDQLSTESGEPQRPNTEILMIPDDEAANVTIER